MTETNDITEIEIPDPQFGGVDESVMRTMLGDKDMQLVLATSHVTAQQATIARLREQAAAWKAKYEAAVAKEAGA